MGSRPAAVAVLLLAVGLATGAPAEPFQRFEGKISGHIHEVFPADVTGDGLIDLVASYTTGLPPDLARHVAVFVQRPGAGFESAPTFTADVDRKFVLIDTAPRTTNGNGETIYLLAHDGLYRWPFSAPGGFGRPEPVVQPGELVLYPDDSTLPSLDFARAWKGDGKPWAMLPVYEKLLFVPLDAPGAAPEVVEADLFSELETAGLAEQSTSLFAARSSISIPVLATADADADGRADLFATRGEKVWCFLRGPDGRFSRRPDRTYRLPVLEPAERKLRNASVSSTVLDLNGDGRADLVQSKFGGEFPKLKTTVRVHLARPSGDFVQEPDFSLTSEGFSGNVRFPDVNGDGKRDLLLPHARLGIADLVRIMVRKNVDVLFSVYATDANGGYAKGPAYSRKVHFDVDWRAGFTMVGVPPRMDGDFDADGRGDLIVGRGIDQVQVFRAGRDPARLFAPRPDAEVACPASLFFFVADLNNDRFADFFVYYPLDPDRQGSLLVFLNRREWGAGTGEAPRTGR